MIVSAQLGTGHNAHGGAGVDIFWNATRGDCQLRQTVSFIFRKIQFVISVEESLFVPMYKNAEWTMFIYIFGAENFWKRAIKLNLDHWKQSSWLGRQ